MTTELDGGPTTTDGFLASTDCAEDVFWSAWSASDVSADVISMSLPSTPPAALMSFCASFMVAMLAGPRYAMEPVSGNRPAAMNVSDFALPDEPDMAFELLMLPESLLPLRQPDSSSAAATAQLRRAFCLCVISVTLPFISLGVV